MADVVKFCTSGTLVKNVLDNFFFIFIYVEVQTEQIKLIQSFIGLASLIFEINGKNWQFMTFWQSKPHKDGIMLRIGRLCLRNPAFRQWNKTMLSSRNLNSNPLLPFCMFLFNNQDLRDIFLCPPPILALRRTQNLGERLVLRAKILYKKRFAFPEGFSDQTRYISRLL